MYMMYNTVEFQQVCRKYGQPILLKPKSLRNEVVVLEIDVA